MFSGQYTCLWEKEPQGCCRHEPCFELHSLKLMIKELFHDQENFFTVIGSDSMKIYHWLLIYIAV